MRQWNETAWQAHIALSALSDCCASDTYSGYRTYYLRDSPNTVMLVRETDGECRAAGITAEDYATLRYSHDCEPVKSLLESLFKTGAKFTP